MQYVDVARRSRGRLGTSCKRRYGACDRARAGRGAHVLQNESVRPVLERVRLGGYRDPRACRPLREDQRQPELGRQLLEIGA